MYVTISVVHFTTFLTETLPYIW